MIVGHDSSVDRVSSPDYQMIQGSKRLAVILLPRFVGVFSMRHFMLVPSIWYGCQGNKIRAH